jgi:fructan beta-fructosidase
LAVHSTPISAGSTYRLKVVATGTRLQVYLDNDATPVIDVTDTAYSSGLFGLNVYSGTMTAQNANLA